MRHKTWWYQNPCVSWSSLPQNLTNIQNSKKCSTTSLCYRKQDCRNSERKVLWESKSYKNEPTQWNKNIHTAFHNENSFCFIFKREFLWYKGNKIVIYILLISNNIADCWHLSISCICNIGKFLFLFWHLGLHFL